MELVLRLPGAGLCRWGVRKFKLAGRCIMLPGIGEVVYGEGVI